MYITSIIYYKPYYDIKIFYASARPRKSRPTLDKRGMPIAAIWFQEILRGFEAQDRQREENIRGEYLDNVRSYLDIYGYIGLKCLAEHDGQLQEATTAAEYEVEMERIRDRGDDILFEEERRIEASLIQNAWEDDTWRELSGHYDECDVDGEDNYEQAIRAQGDDLLFMEEEYENYYRQSMESDRWQDGHSETCDSDGEDNDDQAIRAQGDDIMFDAEEADMYNHDAICEEGEEIIFMLERHGYENESIEEQYIRINFGLGAPTHTSWEHVMATFGLKGICEALRLRSKREIIIDSMGDDAPGLMSAIILYSAYPEEACALREEAYRNAITLSHKAMDCYVNRIVNSINTDYRSRYEINGDGYAQNEVSVAERAIEVWFYMFYESYSYDLIPECCFFGAYSGVIEDALRKSVRENISQCANFLITVSIANCSDEFIKRCRNEEALCEQGADLLFDAEEPERDADDEARERGADMLSMAADEQAMMDAWREDMEREAREFRESRDNQLREWGGEDVRILWNRGGSDNHLMMSMYVKDILRCLEKPYTFNDISHFMGVLSYWRRHSLRDNTTEEDIVWCIEGRDHSLDRNKGIASLNTVLANCGWEGFDINEVFRAMTAVSIQATNDNEEEEVEEDRNITNITRDMDISLTSCYFRSNHIPEDIARAIAPLIVYTARNDGVNMDTIQFYLQSCLHVLERYEDEDSPLIEQIGSMLRQYENSDWRQIDNNPDNITIIISRLKEKVISTDANRRALITLNRARQFARDFLPQQKIVKKQAEPTQSIPHRIAISLISDAIAKGLECPITLQPLKTETTAITQCFHFYEKEALGKWLTSNHICPQCRQPTQVLAVVLQ